MLEALRYESDAASLQKWVDYCYWQNQDKENLKQQTNQDVQRDPFTGIGKPEPLNYDYQGAWLRP